jgi:hypothetical protein
MDTQVPAAVTGQQWIDCCPLMSIPLDAHTRAGPHIMGVPTSWESNRLTEPSSIVMMLISMHDNSQSQCMAKEAVLIERSNAGSVYVPIQCLLVTSKSQEMLYRKDHHPVAPVADVCVSVCANHKGCRSLRCNGPISRHEHFRVAWSAALVSWALCPTTTVPQPPRYCEGVGGLSCCSVSSGSQGQSAWPCHLLDLSHTLLAGGLLALASLHSLSDCSLSVLLSDLSASPTGG